MLPKHLHLDLESSAAQPKRLQPQDGAAGQTPRTTPSGTAQDAAVAAHNAALPNAPAPASAPPVSSSDPNGDLSATGPAVPVPPGTIAAVAQVAAPALLQAAGGDGKRVNLAGRSAVATGGDTSLGRTLTRAALAADARAANTPNVRPAATAPDTGTPDAPNPAKAGLAAFVRSFEAALKSDVSGAAVLPMHDSGPAPLPPHAAADAIAPGAQPAVVAIADRAQPAPPAAPATLPAPIDHSAIADQVLRGAFMRTAGSSSEMRLSLVPQTLGDVNIKLVVEAGNVTAHLLAQTPEVRDALTAAQPQLSKALADAGLKLTSLRVDLSGDGFAGFSQQHNDQSQNGNRARRAGAYTDAGDGEDDAALDAIPSFGPSIVARPSAGDYNYLA